MVSLHCCVLALYNWIDWRYSLNSQSYCGCHPVFIFLSSSVIKSPAEVSYSYFHEVLSIMSNIYFIVFLFSFTLSLYRTQCWGREHQPVSECEQLQGLRVQGIVLDLYLYLWMEFSGIYEDNKDLGCLSPLVLIKLIERRRPKALTFLTLLSLILSQQGIVNMAWIQQNNKSGTRWHFKWLPMSLHSRAMCCHHHSQAPDAFIFSCTEEMLVSGKALPKGKTDHSPSPGKCCSEMSFSLALKNAPSSKIHGMGSNVS